MSRFSLINRLDGERKEQLKRDPNAPNITYQQYDLDVHGDSVPVLIPMRECENFETKLVKEKNLSNHRVKRILREFNGLLVRDE